MISVYHNIEYDVRLQVASGNGKNETNNKQVTVGVTILVIISNI